MASRLKYDSASSCAVESRATDARQASANCRLQRHWCGSSRGRKRSGESLRSSQPGTLGSTPGPASGAT